MKYCIKVVSKMSTSPLLFCLYLLWFTCFWRIYLKHGHLVWGKMAPVTWEIILQSHIFHITPGSNGHWFMRRESRARGLAPVSRPAVGPHLGAFMALLCLMAYVSSVKPIKTTQQISRARTHQLILVFVPGWVKTMNSTEGHKADRECMRTTNAVVSGRHNASPLVSNNNQYHCCISSLWRKHPL